MTHRPNLMSMLSRGQAEKIRRQILCALEMDGITESDAKQRVDMWQSKGSDGAFLARLGGDNTRELAIAYAVPIHHQRNIGRKMVERGKRHLTRLPRRLRNRLSPEDYAKVSRAIVELEQAALPAYQAAHDDRLIANTAVFAALARIPRRVYAEIREFMLMANVELPMVLKCEAPQPLWVLAAIKCGLDDQIASARCARQGNAIRRYWDIRADLVAAIDQERPLYAEARAAFPGVPAIEDAMEFGYRCVGGRIHNSQKHRKQLSPIEQHFFRLGMGQREAEAAARDTQAEGTQAKGTQAKGTHHG